MISISDSPAALLVCALLLAGCEPDKPSPYQETLYAPPEGPAHRFRVELQGSFNAGYQGHRRDILTVTDTKTGKVYLGITGVGVTELFQEKRGKHTVTEEE